MTYTEFDRVTFNDGTVEILCDECVAVARKFKETWGATHQGVLASQITAPVRCGRCSAVLLPVRREAIA
jgi:hypothetical protein